MPRPGDCRATTTHSENNTTNHPPHDPQLEALSPLACLETQLHWWHMYFSEARSRSPRFRTTVFSLGGARSAPAAASRASSAFLLSSALAVGGGGAPWHMSTAGLPLLFSALMVRKGAGEAGKERSGARRPRRPAKSGEEEESDGSRVQRANEGRMEAPKADLCRARERLEGGLGQRVGEKERHWLKEEKRQMTCEGEMTRLYC